MQLFVGVDDTSHDGVRQNSKLTEVQYRGAVPVVIGSEWGMKRQGGVVGRIQENDASRAIVGKANRKPVQTQRRCLGWVGTPFPRIAFFGAFKCDFADLALYCPSRNRNLPS
jgi:hypothetical protein